MPRASLRPPRELADRPILRGITFRGRLAVVESHLGPPHDLTGAAASWSLFGSEAAGATRVLGPLTLTAGGIAFEGDPALGVLIVTVSKTLTTGLLDNQVYWQEWVITDGIGDVAKYRGRVSSWLSQEDAA